MQQRCGSQGERQQERGWRLYRIGWEEGCWGLVEQWQERQSVVRWDGERRKKRGEEDAVWAKVLGAR